MSLGQSGLPTPFKEVFHTVVAERDIRVCRNNLFVLDTLMRSLGARQPKIWQNGVGEGIEEWPGGK